MQTASSNAVDALHLIGAFKVVGSEAEKAFLLDGSMSVRAGRVRVQRARANIAGTAALPLSFPLALRLTHDGESVQSEDEDVEGMDAMIQCGPIL